MISLGHSFLASQLTMQVLIPAFLAGSDFAGTMPWCSSVLPQTSDCLSAKAGVRHELHAGLEGIEVTVQYCASHFSEILEGCHLLNIILINCGILCATKQHEV